MGNGKWEIEMGNFIFFALTFLQRGIRSHNQGWRP